MAIGRTNAGGSGSAALNFKIVQGITQPGTAVENTIWVETEKITSWTFSATEPTDPVEGMVWIPTGTSSPVEFNALKKNCLFVYPQSAKQFIDGAWVDRNAMIYQDGVWNDSMNKLYFYKRGDTANSGGFGFNNASNVVFNEDHIYLQGLASIAVFAHTYSPVPLRYKKMVIVGEVVSQINNVCFQACGLAEASEWDVAAVWNHGTVGEFAKTIDISGVNDSSHRYVKIAMGTSPSCIGKIYEIYFTA